MTKKILFLTALLAIPIFGAASSEAKARGNSDEYCREYTKTVSINGRTERAYGTACYKPDGSWEIVDLEGSRYARDQVRDVIYDDIERQVSARDRDRVIIVERYDRRAPRYYRASNRYHSVAYNSWPFSINWNINSGRGYHKPHHYKKHHYNKRHYYNKRYNKGRKYNGRYSKSDYHKAPVVINVNSKNSKRKDRDDRRGRNNR